MTVTKGIILAGGSGTRMFPVTNVYSKQLIMVYDKPLIYYPLSTLMLSGIKDIMIISNGESIPSYSKLLSDGSHLGINIEYGVQKEPRGIAEAFIIADEFIGEDNVALILGDNIFYGEYNKFRNAVNGNGNATIFGYYVSDPERYGVIEFDGEKPVSIIEKPKEHVSHYAVPGFYIYDSSVVDIARSLKPSDRGELEITDVNNIYLGKDKLDVVKLGRGFAWLDTGTPASMMDASNFIETIEKRQSLKIGCIEEIAMRMDYIGRDEFIKLTSSYPDCAYRDYLLSI
ncbi:MAG: glucose-1-phosphate thymidylyltransferase RfbA [candidate division WOR-3 bacterium]|nr:glucose-1-phosphate thymidylyltransferase RfbA [candidate division WOR-3 bacterium]